jgi:hypothetical protein
VTDREAAVAELHSQGFHCSADPANQDWLRGHFMEAGHSPNDDRSKEDFVDCQVDAPRFGVTGVLDILTPLETAPSSVGTIYGQNWFVELEFNADGHLSDALISVMNQGPRLW